MERSYSTLAGVGGTGRVLSRRLWSRMRRYSRGIVQSRYVQTITTLLTIFALFGEDIRFSASEKSADLAFDVITLVCIGVFFVEMVLATVGVEAYRLSFFFWLDFVSTCSLVLDVSFVAEPLFGGGDSSAAEQRSQLGARAARLARIVRLIRLVRIVKLYKALGKKKEPKKKLSREDPEAETELNEEEEMLELAGDEEGAGDEQPVEESKISKKLSEKMTKKVILLVLAMVFAKPFFQNEQYFKNDEDSAQAGLDSLHLSFLRAAETCETYGVSSVEYGAARSVYEHDLLQYVYYHNWGARNKACPEGDACYSETYTGYLVWLGFTASSSADSTCYGHPEISQLLTEQGGSVPQLTKYANSYFDSTQFNVRMLKVSETAMQRLTEAWTLVCTAATVGQDGVSLETSDAKFCPEDLRYSERRSFSVRFAAQSTSSAYFEAFFDKRELTQHQAVLSIYQTVFICFVLALGSVVFARDANTLLLEPIERMIKKVELIRLNPLHAIKLGDEQYKREEVAKAKLVQDYKKASNWLTRWIALRRMKKPKEPLETVLLEKTIIKIGSLLALGFGEAGAEILGKNMQGQDSGINAMVPGKRVEAIFGICTIKNFGLLTSVLQDKVLLLVNEVAEILHAVVNEYHGVANRNINEAFLLVWKFPEIADQSPNAKAARARFADFALVAFSKVLVAVSRSPALNEYRSNPKILQFMADYKVTLNFGLHAGWAIEGAIGSEFKIDATYLSQDAAMVNLIEAWNKEYGTKLLCSGSFVDRLSPNIKRKLRRVDAVTLPRSRDVTNLFTLDLDPEALASRLAPQKTFVAKRGRNVNPFKVRQLRESRKTVKLQNTYDVASEWEADPDYFAMRKKFKPEFQDLFNMAFLNYEAGQWGIAKAALEQTREMLGSLDGPSETLYRYMAQFDFQAPKEWKGFRELNE